AALQLICSGLFPCSLVYLMLAVDVQVLDFVQWFFLQIAPNYIAWCATVMDFLGSQGHCLPGDDPLRWRLSNALQWFISLHDAASKHISNILSDIHHSL
ncbi:hypothetical protein GYMLUDRAFT_130552, partial [Collybiopsis luxurians FD-317 M1]